MLTFKEKVGDARFKSAPCGLCGHHRHLVAEAGGKEDMREPATLNMDVQGRIKIQMGLRLDLELSTSDRAPNHVDVNYKLPWPASVQLDG